MLGLYTPWVVFQRKLPRAAWLGEEPQHPTKVENPELCGQGYSLVGMKNVLFSVVNQHWFWFWLLSLRSSLPSQLAASRGAVGAMPTNWLVPTYPSRPLVF